jgi:hypothetical protein
MLPSTDVTMERLEGQIEWYDSKSNHNQTMYKWLKVIEIGVAASIPFSAGVGMSALVTGGSGVLITVLEGLQHLNQYQHNWITYRSTCESLKHEKYLYLAKAGPYAVADPHALFAERVESLVSQEHAKWAAAQEPVAKKMKAD